MPHAAHELLRPLERGGDLLRARLRARCRPAEHDPLGGHRLAARRAVGLQRAREGLLVEVELRVVLVLELEAELRLLLE